MSNELFNLQTVSPADVPNSTTTTTTTTTTEEIFVKPAPCFMESSRFIERIEVLFCARHGPEAGTTVAKYVTRALVHSIASPESLLCGIVLMERAWRRLIRSSTTAASIHPASSYSQHANHAETDRPASTRHGRHWFAGELAAHRELSQPDTVAELYAAAVAVATKTLDDEPYNLATHALLLGSCSCSRLASRELQLLNAIHFRTYVSNALLYVFAEEFMRSW